MRVVQDNRHFHDECVEKQRFQFFGDSDDDGSYGEKDSFCKPSCESWLDPFEKKVTMAGCHGNPVNNSNGICGTGYVECEQCRGESGFDATESPCCEIGTQADLPKPKQCHLSCEAWKDDHESSKFEI